MVPVEEDFLKEVVFKTSRSGGSGGQNVNKVSTKVELIFNIPDSLLFSPEEKALLLNRLRKKIDRVGNFHIVSQEDRSQLTNKKNAVDKALKIIDEALKQRKKRIPTKTPKTVILKRLTDKSVKSSKKENRRRPTFD
ncbi:MAG: aminoacyl-tRNA hydrolase [Pedobacter sp.]|nr:MAG: aminoacyl-tRNA hydrolase [Pedobacter sp.]